MSSTLMFMAGGDATCCIHSMFSVDVALPQANIKWMGRYWHHCRGSINHNCWQFYSMHQDCHVKSIKVQPHLTCLHIFPALYYALCNLFRLGQWPYDINKVWLQTWQANCCSFPTDIETCFQMITIVLPSNVRDISSIIHTWQYLNWEWNTLRINIMWAKLECSKTCRQKLHVHVLSSCWQWF